MKKFVLFLTVCILFTLTAFAGCKTVASNSNSNASTGSESSEVSDSSTLEEESSTVETFTITWVIDGEEITSEVERGVTPVYEGTPTKEPTESKTFTFAGWDTDPVPATSDATYVAIFNEELRKFTVTWHIEDKLSTVDELYNATPSHEDAYAYGLIFKGWAKAENGEIIDLANEKITQDTHYYAVFTDTSVWDGSFPNVAGGYTFRGRGTQDAPWLIESARDLAALSRLTTNTKSYGKGLYYKLTVNVDLSVGGWVSICDSNITQGEWHNITNFFSANFDGSNKTITFKEENAPLCFGLFMGLADCTVENLNLEGSIKGGHYHSALATYLNGGVTVKNVTSNVDITITGTINDPQARTGAIAGQVNGNNNALINCVNNGDITALGTQGYVGGLVGFAYGELAIENCANNGTVKGMQTASTVYGVKDVYVGTLIGSYNKYFNVTFNVNGKENSSSCQAGSTPVFNDTISVPGFAFIGWALEENGEATAFAPVMGDVTYYAILEENTNKHTVTWIEDGTSTEETYLHNATPSRENPEKSGFVFIGWALEENGAIIDLESQPITEDKTYYAVFVDETYLTAEEFSQQFSHYGTPSMQTATTRIRTSFAVKMQAGTIFTFSGDTGIYKWSVNETQNTANMFASSRIDPGWNEAPNATGQGWQSNTKYVTQTVCYPVIVMIRKDGKDFTEDEILMMKAWFTVIGAKQSPLTSTQAGAFTEEEYKSQVASFGSVPLATDNTRAKISIVIRLRKGAVINYLGGSTYNWSLVESNNPSQKVSYIDSGWLTDASRTTDLDGSYVTLTVKKSAGGSFTKEEVADIHKLFTVTGTKLGLNEIPEVEQKDYAMKSIAHRGYSFMAPENTLPAYELAAKMGFKYVECDIVFTKDGVPVLIHDDTIDRTSNGSGEVVNMTLEDLRKYDYGFWMGLDYLGTKIPTFEEFIILCKELNLHPYIEIKWTNTFNLTSEQARVLTDIVNKNGMQGKISFISFSSDALAKIAACDSTARLGWVYSNEINASVINTANSLKTAHNEVFIDAYYSRATQTAADLCNQASIPLEVWTVDSLTVMNALNPYVSGISSNWILAGAYLEN